MNRASRARSGALALTLVVLMLLGSVAIPARLSWRILHVLAETIHVVEPARLAVERLQGGVAIEGSAMHEYEVFRDTGALHRYRAAVAADDAQLADLGRLAVSLGDGAPARVAAVRSRLQRTRMLEVPAPSSRGSPAEFENTFRSRQADRDSTVAALNALAVYLAREDAARDARISGSEWRSVLVNASLVVLSLGALFAVTALVNRERRATAALRRRAEEEAALREAAEAFSETFSIEGVARRAAAVAHGMMRARGAFVELIVHRASGRPSADVVVVDAAAGRGTPAPGMEKPYAGSLAEAVVRGGGPLLIPTFAYDEDWLEARSDLRGSYSAIVLPLANSKEPIGALLVLSEAEHRFDSDDLERAGIISHLMWLACEKIRLFEESDGRRRELERLVRSRSRLMRGFSHDVKNPLGAADGYAELLEDGIYGGLSAEQRQAVKRMRGSIGTALALIEDLQALARAETGRVALATRAVDIGELVALCGDEYRGAASARGLSLSVAPGEPLQVQTDGARVRQIVSNLLSNAIKYTERGSIVLRAYRRRKDDLEWTVIEVTDTGSGIPSDKHQSIFQEFVRLDVTDKPGAGLGLAISQRLATALGGVITVTSEVGSGSTFTLWLPLLREERQFAAVPQTAQLTIAPERPEDVLRP